MARVATDNAWNLMEEMQEQMGAENLLTALAKAMGLFDLAENLEYICRMEDIDSEYIEHDEDDDEDEWEDEDE